MDVMKQYSKEEIIKMFEDLGTIMYQAKLNTDYRKYNKTYEKTIEIFKYFENNRKLAISCLKELMKSDNIIVRRVAATFCLALGEKINKAEKVLYKISVKKANRKMTYDEKSLYGECALVAETLLGIWKKQGYLEVYEKDEDKTKENKYKDIDHREGYNEYIKSHTTIMAKNYILKIIEFLFEKCKNIKNGIEDKIINLTDSKSKDELVITMEEEKNLKEYKDIIISFLEGELDIISFRKIYDTQPGVNDYLQLIIDKLKTKQKKRFLKKRTSQDRHLSVVCLLISPEKDPGIKYGCPPRYTSVRQCLNYEYRMITHNVETVGGALKFYNEVYEIYYQVDKSIKYYSHYSDEYSFALDVIPRYLCGGEAEIYIQKRIIPLYPNTMKKEDRKKAIRAKIKEEFKSEKGYPRWIQESEWPLDKEGKPATYIGKGKCENETCCYLFRDETTKEIIEIEQYY